MRIPERRADGAAAFAVIAVLILIALAQLVHGGVFYSQWAPDLFIPLEGVHHLRYGQWPHRDFVTPVGSVWYLINAVPTLVMPISAKVLVWANLIVALIAAIGTLAVCLGKIERPLAALAAVYVGLVALSPRQVGEGFRHVSNNASYNRHCWALIAVVALATLLPASPTHPARRRHDLIDALVCAVLIALCFYIKITYAAAGFGLIGAAVLTTRGFAGWRFAALASSLALTLIAAFGVLTGDLGGYLADMKTAVAVLPDTARRSQIVFQTAYALPYLALVVVLPLFARAGEDGIVWRFNRGQIAGVLVLICGVLIGVQNHREPENPMVPIALLIGWTMARAGAGQGLRISRQAGSRVLAAVFVMLMAADLGAIVWTMVAAVDRGKAVHWLDRTAITDLRIAAQFTGPIPDSEPIKLSDAMILDRWREADLLLRPYLAGRHDRRILPFTWSNPFPLLYAQPPVRNEVAWWDAERTFNPTHRPDPSGLLGGVDLVLVPYTYANPKTLAAMHAAYDGELLRDFAREQHTAHWDLWVRKHCAEVERC